MIVDNGVIEWIAEEPGKNDEGLDDDPYGETTPEAVLDYFNMLKADVVYG